jgi:hypothetical protein
MKPAPQEAMNTATHFNARCHVDLIGPFPLSKNKNKYQFDLSPALAVTFNISPGRWQHFPLWPLFLQRDKGKQTEMTGTQHVGAFQT